MGNFQIRDATSADVTVLKNLFRKSSLSNHGDRANLLANPDALEWSNVDATEWRTRVVSVDDGQIVGFASTTETGNQLELEDMFVDPGWMRQGIGRSLVLDAVSIAREVGFSCIEVTANPHALEFYENVGFSFVGTAETRFGPATRMRLQVPGIAMP